MTITADITDGKQYVSDGLTVSYTVPWRINDASEVEVRIVDNVVKTTVPAIYTVSGVRLPTATITLSAPVGEGKTIVILPSGALVQPYAFRSQGALDPGRIEDAFDSIVKLMSHLLSGGVMRLSLVNGEFVWDAKGNRIANLGDGKFEKDAVNLGQLLDNIESALTGGPTYGVHPLYWQIHGDGVTTDFEVSGATVTSELLYDVVVSGAQKEPFDEYTVVGGVSDGSLAIRFVTPPANLSEGFIILRGYARPWGAVPLVTTLRIPMIDLAGSTMTADNAAEFSLVRSTGAVASTITIRKNTGALNDFKTGSYFSVRQVGLGQVTIAGESGVTVSPPVGFLAKTRGVGSVISLVCENADMDLWAVANDVAAA